MIMLEEEKNLINKMKLKHKKMQEIILEAKTMETKEIFFLPILALKKRSYFATLMRKVDEKQDIKHKQPSTNK